MFEVFFQCGSFVFFMVVMLTICVAMMSLNGDKENDP